MHCSKSENKGKKEDCYNNAKKLCNTPLSIYYRDYDEITDKEPKFTY